MITSVVHISSVFHYYPLLVAHGLKMIPAFPGIVSAHIPIRKKEGRTES